MNHFRPFLQHGNTRRKEQVKGHCKGQCSRSEKDLPSIRSQVVLLLQRRLQNNPTDNGEDSRNQNLNHFNPFAANATVKRPPRVATTNPITRIREKTGANMGNFLAPNFDPRINDVAIEYMKISMSTDAIIPAPLQSAENQIAAKEHQLR